MRALSSFNSLPGGQDNEIASTSNIQQRAATRSEVAAFRTILIDNRHGRGHTSWKAAASIDGYVGGSWRVARHQAESKEAPLGRVQSLVRAFGLLDELAKNDSMTLSELASLVSLPRSTTHRLLTTMQALRYVAFDRETTQWSIGVQAFAVGSVFAQSRGLGNLGRPIMRSLMSEVHHCVNFAVPERQGICYVGQVAQNGFQQTAARPGAVLPLHTTASGKAIMAHWSRSEVDRYLRGDPLKSRTTRSIVDRDRLRHELVETYERGYAFDDEEHEMGLRCVAAVVHDRCGAPCGALSISDRSSRLTRARLDELGPTLVLTARQMSTEVATRLF